jgi:tripartite-type tricarboxylate transporter receptor subunit TctC
MMRNQIRIALVAFLSCLTISAGFSGRAQAAENYPSRPIGMVVLLAAGGVTDVAARAISAEMAKTLDGTIVIENRPGAAGNIGAASVAHAMPDGYTVCFCSSAPLTLLPAQREDQGFKPEELTPVTLLYRIDLFLIARRELGVTSLQQLIDLAKSKPGKLTYGSTGAGSITHLGVELLKKTAGIDMVHVPYKGGAPLMIDLLSGQIDLGVVSSLEAVNYQNEGKITVVASMGTARFWLLKDVPTIGETFPGYVADSWAGLFVPNGTPQEVIDKLRNSAQAAMALPDIRDKLATLGITPASDASPEAFKTMMSEERAKWTELIQQIGLGKAN